MVLTRLKTIDIPKYRVKLYKKQKGICPICKGQIKDPVLDHDHKTEATRDVLCRNCNRFEGKVLKWANTVPISNTQLLTNLIKYWVKHSINRHGLLHPLKIKRKRRRAKKK